MKKNHILFNRPIYIGMCVLDLSKILLYDYYYNYLKPKYGENCQLLYTDTDSLLLHIHCEDFYKDIGETLHLYDTSDYPEDHPQHSMVNNKIPGKLKDEVSGKPIQEVVCLRSKMYSILLDDDTNTKKAKGTKQCVVKKVITHQNYKDALFEKKSFKHEMQRFGTENHVIYTHSISTRLRFRSSIRNDGSRQTVCQRGPTATRAYQVSTKSISWR